MVVKTLLSPRLKGLRKMSMMFFVLAFVTVFAVPAALGEESNIKNPLLSTDFTDLSLEELMAIDLTLATRTPKSRNRIPAAVYIIDREKIRRSTATSIPELLRMVPGLHVASIDNNKWAISIRGFNSRFANKLLVMIDGRTVYTPLMSGVYWDIQDTMLADIDRIEIVRGPGAALWGANAVNGVINIITKNAAQTRGILFNGLAGNQHYAGNLRFGGTFGENTTYRIWSKYFNYDGLCNCKNLKPADDWHGIRAGFRLDSTPSKTTAITLSGELYDNQTGQISTLSAWEPPYRHIFSEDPEQAGGHLLGRLQYNNSATSNTQLQIYFDRTEREEAVGAEDRNTLDIDFQHHFKWGAKNDIVWGLGYRISHDKLTETEILRTLNDNTTYYHLYSGFIQDEITLIDNLLEITIGAKIEHNSYTGFEFQPNIRALLTLNPKHTFWAAISRALRTPSRYEVEGQINYILPPGFPNNPFPNPPLFLSTNGSDDYESEELIAYEIGYRYLNKNFSLDLTAFYNDYDELRTYELVGFDFNTPPYLHLTRINDNKMYGHTSGFELLINFPIFSWWEIECNYSYQRTSMQLDSSSSDTGNLAPVEGDSPRHQALLHSSLDLPLNLNFDGWLRYVDELPNQKGVDSYITLDLRLAWQPREKLELSLSGRNLLEHRHLESTQDYFGTITSPVERSFYAEINWQF